MPKDIVSIKYAGISFNATHIADQPLEKFVSENKHHGLKDEQLREVHGMAVSEVKKPVAKEAGKEQKK